MRDDYLSNCSPHFWLKEDWAMNYEQDIFISYCHLDNKPLTAEQQGWVSRFHESLEHALAWRMGHLPRIWRDQKIKGDDMFEEEIVAQFPKVAILVSVLSPCYLESEWCRREVSEFCKAAEQSGEIVVDNKSRIIKVIKCPPKSQESLPSLMKKTLGYEFFVYQDERPLELEPSWGPELGQRYSQMVVKLAYDIARLKETLDGKAPSAGQKSTSRTPIYVAQCSHDRRDSRDALVSELQLHGYPILPDKALDVEEEQDFTSEVTQLLNQCNLSVHLVGNTYGAVPDGPSHKSIMALENELAVAESKRRGLRRLIWLPEGTQGKGPEQQQFIEALTRDRDAQFGADLITTSLETLKTAIYSTLQALESPRSRADKARSPAAPKVIYLVFAKADREATRPLRKWIADRGFDVETPVFEGDSFTVRQANQDTLERCDAVLLFYGSGDEAWRHVVLSEIRKNRGDQPPLPCFVYLAQPVTDDKSDLMAMRPSDLIEGLEGLNEAALRPLLDALQKV
jgi:hypothetical protein